jgi:hypothetical protein
MVIEEDWHEFAPAFAEAVRPDDTRGRSVKRLLVIGFAALLAAALNAVVYGALSARHSAAGHPASGITAGPGATPGLGATAVPSATAGPASRPGTSTWTAVAGPTCSNGATRFTVSGYYRSTSNSQATGWSTSGSGGYSGNGCAGGFVSVPLSGHAYGYDSNRFALWRFHLSAGFTRAACALSVFVPYNPQIAYVGGDPAYYLYYGTDYSSGSRARPLGSYLVDQLTTRGEWVASRSFTVKTGWVAVRLLDAGVNQTRATRNAHAAAAQMRLTCHAAP